MLLLKIVFVAIVTAGSGFVGLAVLWQAGFISRVVASTMSPDGRIEAVCRGRLPESTEYDLWFRGRGDVFGVRLGLVGSETMGRCRLIAWSPDGRLVATVSEGGSVGVFDGRSGKPVGFQRLPGPDGNYPSTRIITRFAFESLDTVTYEHCDRLWFTTRRREDHWRCGSNVSAARAALALEAPRGFFGR